MDLLECSGKDEREEMREEMRDLRNGFDNLGLGNSISGQERNLRKVSEEAGNGWQISVHSVWRNNWAPKFQSDHSNNFSFQFFSLNLGRPDNPIVPEDAPWPVSGLYARNSNLGQF